MAGDTPAAATLEAPPRPPPAPAGPQPARPAARRRAPGEDWRRRKNRELYRELEGGPAAERGAPRADRAPPAALQAREKPEVLAPAGGWPQLEAAVCNGADAVYFGLSLGLNARARASNFSPEELPRVMRYVRARGVKAFVTVNTLVYDEELFGSGRGGSDGELAGGAALDVLRCVQENRVDAVIVQDIGLALACRRLCPDVPVHASTQMSVTSASGARFAAEVLGASRVVLGRELSVQEMAQVSAGAPGVELEAFVHGALCVSYSGQCFSSEAWGGRSANRGQCAQACRMPYALIQDGDMVGLGDHARYLLSPQDMMALEHMPALVEAGIHCFKIEGRLKGPEYVALTTSAYRSAVDEAWASREGSAEPSLAVRGYGAVAEMLERPDSRRALLSQVFSRGQDAEHDGLSAGFLDGPKHQHLVRGQAPKHRGKLVGSVVCIDPPRRAVCISLSAACTALPLSRGAGVVFDYLPGGGSLMEAEEDELGGNVQDIRNSDGERRKTTKGLREGDEVWVQLNWRNREEEERKIQALGRVHEGALVWQSKLQDHLEREIRNMQTQRGLPGMEVTAAASGLEGEPLTITLTDRFGRVGVGRSDDALVSTDVEDLDGLRRSVLDEALGLRAGPPPAEEELARGFWRRGAATDAGRGIAIREGLEGLRASYAQARLAAGRARRHLLELRTAAPAAGGAGVEGRRGRPVHDDHAVLRALAEPPLPPPREWLQAAAPARKPAAGAGRPPRLTLLCRSRAQAEAALRLEDGLVYELQLDFLEAQGLEEAVEAARAAGRRVAVCLPRVLKPGEDKIWLFYRRLRADALLVRSAGALYQLSGFGAGDGGAGDTEAGAGEEASGPRPELLGDFSLNAANTVTAAALLQVPGLRRLTPTHDLSAGQICRLARGLGPERAARLEVVAHQHLPIFHTEHCVFARFLSKGNDFRDCGHPCERHAVHLRDVDGKDHSVMADMGCRNTVFNAQAQSAAKDLADLAAAGVGYLRLELVDEPAEAVGPLVRHYHGALRGVVGPKELWQFLESLPDSNGRAQGVSSGSLDNGVWRARGPNSLRPAASATRRGPKEARRRRSAR